MGGIHTPSNQRANVARNATVKMLPAEEKKKSQQNVDRNGK